MPTSYGNTQNPITAPGLDEMIKAFEELGETALKDIQPTVDSAGDVVLNKVREKVSQYTKYSQYGTLKRSLFLKRPKAKDGAYYNILTWGDDVRKYAAALELGHAIRFEERGKIYGTVPAHSFMRPGADESKDRVHEDIVSGMEKIIDNMGGVK